MFTQIYGNCFIVIFLNVNDIIITGNDVAAIQDLKYFLSTCFKITDLGPLTYFLGVEITWSKPDISFCQQKYTPNILKDAGLIGAKPKTIPMQANIALMPTGSDPLINPTSY